MPHMYSVEQKLCTLVMWILKADDVVVANRVILFAKTQVPGILLTTMAMPRQQYLKVSSQNNAQTFWSTLYAQRIAFSTTTTGPERDPPEAKYTF